MDYSSSGGYGNNTRNTTVRYTQELARPRAYYRPQELAASAPREQQVQQGERSQARGGGSGGEEETGSVTAEWRPAIKSVQRRLNRVWRVSIFILFLVLLATIVHIVQFFIPSGLTNQLYANIVQGNRASVRQAPESRSHDIDVSRRNWLVANNGQHYSTVHYQAVCGSQHGAGLVAEGGNDRQPNSVVCR